MKSYKGCIQDKVQGFNWLVYSGCPFQDAENHYCKFYKIAPLNADSDACAKFFGHTSLRSYGLWFKKKKPSKELIVHETFHAIVMYAELLKTEITEKTEELLAGYQQMLFREVGVLLK